MMILANRNKLVVRHILNLMAVFQVNPGLAKSFPLLFFSTYSYTVHSLGISGQTRSVSQVNKYKHERSTLLNPSLPAHLLNNSKFEIQAIEKTDVSFVF